MSQVIEVKYELGHSYTERWDVSDLYCPHCGDQSVWIEDAGGDYYEGPGHLCAACGWQFTMPRLGASDQYGNQRLAVIRAI